MSKIDSDHQAYKMEVKPVSVSFAFFRTPSWSSFSTTGAWTFDQKERNLRKATHSDKNVTSAFTWDIYFLTQKDQLVLALGREALLR